MQGRTSNPRGVPAWTAWADALTLLLLALSAVVFSTGGWRLSVMGVPISLRSGWRLLLWGAAVAAVRHVVFPRPGLPARLAGAAGRARGSAASAGAAFAAWLREFALAPAAEARSAAGGDGVRQLLAIAYRSRWALLAVAALVIFRSAVFAWWEQAAFNSDHAIVGLMAKHLAEGRAFPLFFYGQSYMLGVEAWLAAPIFLAAGPSVFALELPLVAMNVAVAGLLVLLLRRELGLGQTTALAASLFFVAAPPATALRLVEANGGSVEPFLYVLLLWMLRGRPALFGIVLSFGFLHREFTVYGLFALLLLEAGEGRFRTRKAVRRALVAAGWFILVWGTVQLLQLLSSPMGPGTGIASLGDARTNVGELLRRSCWSVERLPGRLIDVWTAHLPVLFGTAPRSLGRTGIASVSAGQGMPGLGTLMSVSLAAATLTITVRCLRVRARLAEIGFAVYLLLVGLMSIGGYWALSCHRITAETLRYDLLGLLAAVGVAAAFFRLERSRVARAAGVVLITLWASVAAAASARLLTEYVTSPPPDHARAAVDRLVAGGVECARGDYWIAYRFSFLSRERTVVAADDAARIEEYQRRARAEGDGVERIEERPCPGGFRLAGPYYRCPPWRKTP